IEEEKRRQEEEERKRKEEEEQMRLQKIKEEEDRKRREEEEYQNRISKATSKLDALFISNNAPSQIKDTPKKSTTEGRKRKTDRKSDQNKISYEEKKKLLKEQVSRQKTEEETKRKQKEEEDLRLKKEKEIQDKQRKEEEKKRLLEEKERREKEEELKRIKEEELKREEEEKKNRIIERHYFIVDKDSQKKPEEKKIFTLEYLLGFKDWQICKEQKLLSQDVLDHFEDLKKFEEERPQAKGKYKDKPYFQGRQMQKSKTGAGAFPSFEFKRNAATEAVSGTEVNDMQQWGRKDISKEIKLAEQYKELLEEEKKKDPVKNDLTELLNVLTIDNYDETYKKIFEILEQETINQEKFIEVLFQKAVREKAFTNLYAKLCKELDKELPQKADKGEAPPKTTEKASNAKRTSYLRSKLLEKCREIFKMDNLAHVESYIKADTPEEHEQKFKKFLLGNVNFIGELVAISLLSKKIVHQCLENLWKKYDKKDDINNIKLIALEATIILLDKFGTIVNKQQEKIKKEDLETFTKQIEEHLKKLDEIQENSKDLPGYIKYKIINLIEKKKDGWKETKFEKNIQAKGKNEVKKEYEQSQKLQTKKEKGGKLSQEELNNQIDKDLRLFRDHIQEGLDKSTYSWQIVTEIYNIRGNSISEILTAFLESCLDFVSNENYLKIANDYWYDLILYYSKIIKDEEMDDIKNNALDLLSTASNLVLDNNLLVDVWANILYSLNEVEIMYLSDINELKLEGLFEEDIRSIFMIFKTLLSVDKEMEGDIS
ncbi:MAG: MIF4G domain-containing protein, partial [archaeon]|nr:MIF4G domain-containing protein [archaeon]